jgi:hypothetical protein
VVVLWWYYYVRMKVTFDVRHKVRGKELETRVTVVVPDGQDASVASMQSLVATYYKTEDVATDSDMKTERHAEYTLYELEQLVTSGSSLRERLGPHLP